MSLEKWYWCDSSPLERDAHAGNAPLKNIHGDWKWRQNSILAVSPPNPLLKKKTKLEWNFLLLEVAAAFSGSWHHRIRKLKLSRHNGNGVLWWFVSSQVLPGSAAGQQVYSLSSLLEASISPQKPTQRSRGTIPWAWGHLPPPIEKIPAAFPGRVFLLMEGEEYGQVFCR